MAGKSSKTRSTSRPRRDPNRSRAPRLPKAAPLKVPVDVTHLSDRVKLLEGHVNDHGRRIAQVEGSADYWAGLSMRVKQVEDEPRVVVHRASGIDIVWCFVVYTLGAAMAFAVWHYWPVVRSVLPQEFRLGQ